MLGVLPGDKDDSLDGKKEQGNKLEGTVDGVNDGSVLYLICCCQYSLNETTFSIKNKLAVVLRSSR